MTTPINTGAYLQVIAHLDDDLLFMNPDLQATISAGLPITSLYLTAGEANTVPDPRHPGGPGTVLPTQIDCCPQPVGDDAPDTFAIGRADYAGCRQEGARSAWAQMAGVPNNWIRKALTVTNGGWSREVEVNTLSGTTAPISLIFLNLPDWADDNADTKPRCTVTGGVLNCTNQADHGIGASLQHILQDASTRNTVLVTDGMVAQPQSYALADLTELITQLVNLYDITVVRLQDPKPDNRYEQQNRSLGWEGDHLDHMMAARIVAEAIAGIARLQVVNYRDYNTQESQANLDLAQQNQKDATFDVYAAWDAYVGSDTGYDNWPRREYHRFWAGGNWVGRNADGTLLVFDVRNGALLMWTQTGLGTFSGPVSLGSPGPLAPGLAVSANLDGRVEVFALRLDTWETVTAYQTAVNGSSTQWAWASLGNPNSGSATPPRSACPVSPSTRTAGCRSSPRTVAAASARRTRPRPTSAGPRNGPISATGPASRTDCARCATRPA